MIQKVFFFVIQNLKSMHKKDAEKQDVDQHQNPYK